MTLALLQVTPSHGNPQGSSDLRQLGGTFCHVDLRELSAITGYATHPKKNGHSKHTIGGEEKTVKKLKNNDKRH